MSATDHSPTLPRNDLYRIAAVWGVLVGALFLAGAGGHVVAIWLDLDHFMQISTMILLLPSVLLATTGLINIAVCRSVWRAAAISMRVVLVSNFLLAGYLVYLFHYGPVDHPIGFFLALSSCYCLLLAAIQLGLRWPALPVNSQHHRQR